MPARLIWTIRRLVFPMLFPPASRRQIIGLLGTAASLACPYPALSERREPPVVAVLTAGPKDSDPLRSGLAQLGFEDGRNMRLRFHPVTETHELMRAKARELAAEGVACIVAMGIEAALAAKEATSTTPIIFVFGVDPLKYGFASALNRPEGNVTGMSLYTSELHAKRVELLDEFLAAARPIGMIVNPRMADTDSQVEIAKRAARAKGRTLVVAPASDDEQLENAFVKLSQEHVAGILAVSDNFLFSRRDRIIALARQYAVPMMHPFRADAEAGGLLSYGTSADEMYRSTGIYVGRVLKGEKPADLPIQQPTRFALVLNLGTAKALGITFPPALLVRADEVIE